MGRWRIRRIAEVETSSVVCRRRPHSCPLELYLRPRFRGGLFRRHVLSSSEVTWRQIWQVTQRVQYFQVQTAVTASGYKKRILAQLFVGKAIGNPAIMLTQNADEKRAAAIDLFEA